MVNLRRIVFICLMTSLVIYAVFFHVVKRTDSTFQDTLLAPDSSASVIREQMVKYINTKGAARTYKDIQAIMGTSLPSKQHRVAHIFGELLYKKEGLQGIVVCDSNFAFGCYHSFFGSAIAQNGESIVKELDLACVEAHGPMGLGCPHGIGHGLGEYFGSAQVDKQLNICATLTWKGRYMGCQSGVFMEYNTPVMSDEKIIAPVVRPFNATSPYGICLTVPAQFQPACFLELGAWWEQV